MFRSCNISCRFDRVIARNSESDCGSYGQGVLTKLPWHPLHYEGL